ncbi:putative serine/threonine-protein kinase [Chenopodium quinoa]|uniref:putative serine/threonine-protein kinase n=1 Tax=Chenopodium quinoa TaxID=63459 RepID=UPI000B78E174|nr:putative serine/threonine-protein kinase [Chenopodium quinoa]
MKPSLLGAPTLQGIPVFSYKELKTATSGFKPSNKVGEGSFGSVVYKGCLKDGSIVAVKVLELESLQGEREFISEISALSNIIHENLITLKGCCVTATNRFLIYDYMENNSMELAFLGGSESRRKFSWKMRTDVLIGITRGLAFLHEEVHPHIVHRDIKPANILLDQNFVPKIADFGLAKLFLDSVSHVSTRVAGTS